MFCKTHFIFIVDLPTVLTRIIYLTESSMYSMDETSYGEAYTQQGAKPNRKPEGRFVLTTHLFYTIIYISYIYLCLK